MADASDAAIALPGGMGTFEELSEILIWKQLHLYEKPIVLLSLDGYYRPLLDFFDRMMREKFMNEAYGNLWAVVATPEEAVALIQNFPEYPILSDKYQTT